MAPGIMENVFDVEHLTSSKDLQIGLHETLLLQILVPLFNILVSVRVKQCLHAPN